MAKYPTPEALGEKLKAGEITKEEAIEIMARRARAKALSNLYGGATEQDDAENDRADGPRVGSSILKRYWPVLLGLLILLGLLMILRSAG